MIGQQALTHLVGGGGALGPNEVQDGLLERGEWPIRPVTRCHVTECNTSRKQDARVCVWLGGFLLVVLSRFLWWRRIRAAIRKATPMDLNVPIRVMSSCAHLEAGVFGIWQTALFLAEGIANRLTPPQFDAVLEHELHHVRRHDNLAMAIHMAVEAVLWFRPLVWWIESRLATAPRAARRLDWGREFLHAVAGAAVLAGPIAIGLANASPSQAQSPPSPPLAFEVASIKPNKSGASRAPSMILPGGRFTATNNTLRALILNAYGISASPYLLSGGPSWIDSETYDIDTKAEANAIPAGAPNRVLWEKTRLMLRTLLADRFHLSVRRETKEMPVYELVAARNGPKLKKATEQDCTANVMACHGFSGNPRRLSAPLSTCPTSPWF